MVYRSLFRLVVVLLTPIALRAQAIDSAATPNHSATKSVVVASILGIVPGVGHFYAGEVGRAPAFEGVMTGALLIGSVATAVDCVGGALTQNGGNSDPCGQSSVLDLPTAIVLGLWGWSIYDAGRAAQRTNAKNAQHAVTSSVGMVPVRTATGRARTGIALVLAVPYR